MKKAEITLKEARIWYNKHPYFMPLFAKYFTREELEGRDEPLEKQNKIVIDRSIIEGYIDKLPPDNKHFCNTAVVTILNSILQQSQPLDSI